MRVLLMLLAVVAIAAIPAAAQQTTEKPARPAAATSAKPPAAPATIVNLNTATQAQLESLPGVGAKAAEAILEYREKNGKFKKVEDILETSRSSPYSLTISRLSAHRPVARNR